MRGSVKNVLDLALLYDLRGVHDHHSVAHAQGFALIMGHEYRGHAQLALDVLVRVVPGAGQAAGVPEIDDLIAVAVPVGADGSAARRLS